MENNKYKINASFRECMDKEVYKVVNMSINYVKLHMSKLYRDKINYQQHQQKCKDFIMNLVTKSMEKCAEEYYKSQRSRDRIEEVKRCIKANVDDLISIAVDAMSISLQLSNIIDYNRF